MMFRGAFASFASVPCLPRSAILRGISPLDARAINLQELQQEVKVNIIFLLPHVGSWNRAALGALRVEPLIVRVSLEPPSR